ncbi:MAG: carboxypeptidase-like regulatory domain-containing protein [Thermogutta sp.]
MIPQSKWTGKLGARMFTIMSLILLLRLPTLTSAYAAPPETQPRPAASPPQIRIPDISLGEKGILSGKVVDAQGNPVSQAEIAVYQANATVAKVISGEHGDFCVTGLRPGVYQLIVLPNQGVTVRVWEKRAAPPAARSQLLVVVNYDTVRGQRRIGELLPLDNTTIVVGGMVAAAIAIPIAVANSTDDTEPVSP